MTTIVAKVPDYLAKIVVEVAKRQRVTLDHVVALALASQVEEWQGQSEKKAEPKITVVRKEPEEPGRDYQKWETAEDEKLRKLFNSGASVQEIAQRLHRRSSAIRNRLLKLKLI